jgi:hypothetical protein
MATQGTHLVNNTTNDVRSLLQQIKAVRTTVTWIAERMAGIGEAALDGYAWPEGYTKADFIALYQALDGLPGSIVADAVRNKLFKLVSCIQ